MTDAPGDNAYPVTATVFVIMYKQPKNASRANDAFKFFKWALEEGQKQATELDYVPLPDALIRQVEALMRSSKELALVCSPELIPV